MNSLTHPSYAASHPLLDALLPRAALAAAVAAVRQWRRRARLMVELSGLEDRELADLDLQRSDIGLLAAGHRVPALDGRPARR